MAGTYSDITSELKQAYPTGFFNDPVNLEAPFRARLNRDVPYKMTVEGVATIPLYLTGNWAGLGIIADGAAFPAGGDPSRVQGSVVPQLFTRSIVVGVVADLVGRSVKGSFNTGGIWADRVEKAGPYLGKYLNKIYAGSNRGRFATVEADPGANQITVAKPHALVNLPNGLYFDVYDALSGGAVRDSLSNRSITAVAHSTRIITYSGADQTPVAGDHIFAAGTYARLPYTLDDIVDDGTNSGDIFTLSRTTYPALKARIFSGGGVLRNLTEQTVLSIINEMRQTYGVRVGRVLNNWGQWNKYLEAIASDRRFPVAPGQTTAGVMGMAKGGASIIGPDVDLTMEVDWDIQPRKVYFLDWSTWGLVANGEPDWIGDAEKMLMPTSDGFKAAWVAYLGCLENIFCLEPQQQAVGTDFADPILGDTVAEV